MGHGATQPRDEKLFFPLLRRVAVFLLNIRLGNLTAFVRSQIPKCFGNTPRSGTCAVPAAQDSVNILVEERFLFPVRRDALCKDNDFVTRREIKGITFLSKLLYFLNKSHLFFLGWHVAFKYFFRNVQRFKHL